MCCSKGERGQRQPDLSAFNKPVYVKRSRGISRTLNVNKMRNKFHERTTMRNISGLALLAAILVICGCGRHRPQAPQLGEVERLVRLETIKPTRDDHLSVRRTYTATVEAYEKVDLCARVQAGTTGLRGMRGLVKTIP